MSVALVALLVAWTLTRSPAQVASRRAVGSDELANVVGDARDCQAGEALLAGVSAIRLGVGSSAGPPVRVALSAGSQVLAEGRRGGGWSGSSVTIPVSPRLTRPVAGLELCVEIGPNSEPVFINGAPARPREDLAWQGGSLGGRMTVEELRPGRSSWWSLALGVARRMGFGRAFSGSWIALLVAALMASVAALAVRALLRELV